MRSTLHALLWPAGHLLLKRGDPQRLTLPFVGRVANVVSRVGVNDGTSFVVTPAPLLRSDPPRKGKGEERRHVR